jgi:SnoaL-like domain
MEDQDSVRIALGFMAAVRDRRIKDMLALVDPEIICEPLVRPGRTVYQRHDGMVLFVTDMHTVFGCYQFEIDKITERDGAKVAVQARMLPESGHSPMPAMPIVILFTLRDGLITAVEGEPGTGTP